jgi:hypothetical protein
MLPNHMFKRFQNKLETRNADTMDVTWRDKIIKGRALGRKIGALSAKIVSRDVKHRKERKEKGKLGQARVPYFGSASGGNESKDVRVEMHNCGVSATSCASMCKNVSLFQRRANLISILL